MDEKFIKEQIKLAGDAYIYGYPLVANLQVMENFVNGTGNSFDASAPYNEFGHVRQLAGPEMEFVTPNNDTVYSIAVCDLSQGPLVLNVPDTDDRYYVLQFVDVWTNNFAYIGRRSTGTKKGEFFITTRGYDGEIPEGMQVIHSPTNMFVIVGRLVVNGESDLPAVHKLQDLFKLTPYSIYSGKGTPKPPLGVPDLDPNVENELIFWERFRVALNTFSHPEADEKLISSYKKFGITEPESPFIDIDSESSKILIEGIKEGQNRIMELLSQSDVTPQGWQSYVHVFDYNLDYFEIGTVNEPQWKTQNREEAYIMRAIAARAGLYGNHGYEAVYLGIFIDSDGNQLVGSEKYELQLEKQPPVDAFWSLTMYDVPDFYLVSNPINRYSIGDRTHGLKINDNGSVTIYLQKDSPGLQKESNWLPTPEGDFRPILRMYQPKKDILDDFYVVPAIKKVS